MEDIQAVQLSLRQLGYLSDIIKNPTEKIYNSRKIYNHGDKTSGVGFLE